MKKQLQEIELEAVSGGKVILSEPLGVVGFNTLGEVYHIKGVYKDMRNLLNDLYDEHANSMTATQFDVLVRDEFMNRGWI